MSWEMEQIGNCTLYLGDAMEILPTLSPVDAIVTDPPYEGLRGGLTFSWSHLAACRHPTTTVGRELGLPTAVPLFRHHARLGAIVFCSQEGMASCAQALGGTRQTLLVWIKRNSVPSVQNVPWRCNEYAWAVQYAPGIRWRRLRTYFDIPMLQAGCFAQERILGTNGQALHPTQKPVALMQALLCPGMQTVCDPYMGLGTTGIACVRMGRVFIGIENNRRYFECACQRIAQEHAQLDFLADTLMTVPHQEGLL